MTKLGYENQTSENVLDRDLLLLDNPAYFTVAGHVDKGWVKKIIDSNEYMGITFDAVCDWKALDEQDNRLKYRMNSFLFLGPIVRTYVETKDESLRDVMLRWIFSWIEHNSNIVEGTVGGFHDDATARRVVVWSVFYLVAKQSLPVEYCEKIETSLKMQVELLQSDEFYSHRHNHGMFQDQALVLYAVLYESQDEKARILSLAKERVLTYFRYCVTEDGVHKEHSPIYHYRIADAVQWFARIAKDEQDEELLSELSALEQRMINYAMHLIMPNGYTPPIGDSPLRRMRNKHWMNSNEEYKNVVLKNGDQVKKTMAVFKKGGYGIIRSKWGDKDATWMMLLASTFSITHKHNDDLSFLLYHKGDLFVEAGNRNYNYLEPHTKYTYSAYGHNVMILEGEPFVMAKKIPIITDQDKKTQITSSEDTPCYSRVTGMQQRYEDVKQERTLEYDKKRGIVRIKDALEFSKKKVSVRYLYHLAPEITPVKSLFGWRLYKEEALIATVKVLGLCTTRSEIYGDNETSDYKGLVFQGQNEGREGYVLMVDQICHKGISDKLTVEVNLH